jgi:ATP adenylyltransferase
MSTQLRSGNRFKPGSASQKIDDSIKRAGTSPRLPFSLILSFMMHTLHAPWRLDYIKSVSNGPTDCFLCTASLNPEKDGDNLVLARSEHCLLMLNKYPYVNGHLLVAPYRHAPTPLELSADERGQMMELLALGQQALALAMNPQGYNIGLNIGKCAGAGVPGHVHAHIVPRWNGDINFMTIVANVRIIPQAVEEAYSQLREAIKTLQQNSA